MRFSTEPNHIADYRAKTHASSITAASMRKCEGCKRQRSVAQFWNNEKKPIFHYCEKCRLRGVKH